MTTDADTIARPTFAISGVGRHKFINKSNGRKLAMSICAQDIRHKKFTRIAESFWDAIDADTRAAIQRRVRVQPSVGKTLT